MSAATEKNPQATDPTLPTIDFSTFVVSLATSAHLHLGVLPDPTSGKVEMDLEQAQHTIDILAMLEEKTQGNLSADEKDLLNHVLYELRLRFVDQKNKR